MVLVGILGVLSFLVIRPFLLAFFFGLILAFFLHPLYKIFLKGLKNRTVAALLICLLILAVLLVPLLFFTKSLVHESYTIYILAKQKLATGVFSNCGNEFCQTIQDFGKDPIIALRVQEFTRSVTNWVIDQGSSFLLGIPFLILNVFVIFFTMFYFLKEGESFMARMDGYTKRYPEISFLKSRLKSIVRGVVLGYLAVAVIQGIVGGLAFYFFGISSPIFWGTAMAFLALVPYLGTGLIWVPASLIIFLNGLFQDSTSLILQGIGLFLTGVILIGGIDNLLRPKLMGHAAKIHPLIILLGLLGGIFIFGSAGVLIGPLVLSLFVLAIEFYAGNRNKKAETS